MCGNRSEKENRNVIEENITVNLKLYQPLNIIIGKLYEFALCIAIIVDLIDIIF